MIATELPKMKPRDSEPMMIVNELSKIFGDETRKTMEELGVPSGYKNILFHLHHANGASQLELARLTRLKPPTISLTLKKMEEDGYITRQVSKSDMRVYNVYLTTKGANVHIKNRERIDAIDELIMKEITDEEKQQLISLLIKMRNNICEATGRNPSPHCKSENK